jgi:hypothetical protein
MKSAQWKLFAGVLLGAGLMCVACKRESAPTTTTAAPVPVDVGTPEGVPTEAEIAQFMSRYQDPSDDKKMIMFNVKFGSVRFYDPNLLTDYRTRGKIPFGVAVDFHRAEVGGPWGVNEYAIMEGHAEIVVLDADGKLIDRQQKEIASLCPS